MISINLVVGIVMIASGIILTIVGLSIPKYGMSSGGIFMIFVGGFLCFIAQATHDWEIDSEPVTKQAEALTGESLEEITTIDVKELNHVEIIYFKEKYSGRKPDYLYAVLVENGKVRDYEVDNTIDTEVFSDEIAELANKEKSKKEVTTEEELTNEEIIEKLQIILEEEKDTKVEYLFDTDNEVFYKSQDGITYKVTYKELEILSIDEV